MEQQPLISIITVVYNGEKYLEQTIQSVLNQTYNHTEYIIIDGGSTDGTLDLIKKYEKHITYWVSEPDNGLYDAMNKGIGVAKGELIGMINSDDWYELDAVEIIVQNFLENPSKQIFHGDRYNILNDGQKQIRKFHQSKNKLFYYGMTYNHPSMFIHKNIYNEGKYNVNLSALSDYEFVLKNKIKHPKLFHYIQKAYVNYRLDGISAQMKFKDAIKEGYISRKNAGLNLFQNLFAVTIRMFVVLIIRLK